MGTYIVLIIFVIIFALAFYKTRKDMKSGGCAGCTAACSRNQKAACHHK